MLNDKDVKYEPSKTLMFLSNGSYGMIGPGNCDSLPII